MSSYIFIKKQAMIILSHKSPFFFFIIGMLITAIPLGMSWTFEDKAVAEILTLPKGHEPLLLIPVGRPE